jgi:hypothetical protein
MKRGEYANQIFPWNSVPDVGSTIWVMETPPFSDSREMFSCEVVRSEPVKRLGRELQRVWLRGWKTAREHEWSIPQSPYGFISVFFATEADARNARVKALDAFHRRDARKLAKSKNALRSARDEASI